jgi:hypothetical protein
VELIHEALLFSLLVAGAPDEGGVIKSPFFTNYNSEFAQSSGISLVPVKTTDNDEAGNDYQVTQHFPYLFEAIIAPQFSLYENIEKKAMLNHHESPRFGFAFIFVPEVDLRMYGDEYTSVPVRRPNYKPHLTHEGRIFNTINGTDHVDIWNGKISLKHYSNGQDGCLFREEADSVFEKDHIPVRTCEEIPDGTINTLDGEYTSTFFILGLGYKHSKVTNRLQSHYLQASWEIELHPEWDWLFGVETSRQRLIYDRNFKMDFELRYGYIPPTCFGYLLGANFSYFPALENGRRQDVPPTGLDIFAGVRLPRKYEGFKNWSFVIGGYFGQDRMNVDFRKFTQQFNFGLRYSPDFQVYALQ